MDDTIAAIATAPGEGGVGIVRISGKEANRILTEIFKPANSHHPSSITNRRFTYGRIVEPGTDNTIDEAMVVLMEAPATYTREDVVEIQCHGSIVSLRKILLLVLSLGARLADPGEFTKERF